MKTIVVDDQQSTRERVCRVLEAEGFEARQFETADSAAVALSRPSCEVDLVVTDVQMPGQMDGVDLATMLARIRPALPVVVMSSDRRELERATARGIDVPTLEKPFGKDELVAAVADAQRRRSRPRRARISGGVPDRLPPWAADPGPALAAMFREAQAANHPHVGSEHVALVAVAAQFALLDRSRTVRPSDLVAALLGAPRAMAWAGLAVAGLDHGLAVETRRAAMTPEGERTPPKRLS
jgi:DNA-binding response OmpR family regulator